MPPLPLRRLRRAGRGPKVGWMPQPSADESSTPPLRILIVDADRRVRESLRELIACEVGPDAVLAVGTADDARLAAATFAPDVVVIDPRLPAVDSGADLIDDLHARRPTARLLEMCWHGDDRATPDADAGLDMEASPEALVAAILRGPGTADPAAAS
jgi:DNA-binding NarL/FixJ family response regulator